jgi:hypothetical protein
VAKREPELLDGGSSILDDQGVILLPPAHLRLEEGLRRD